MLSRSSVRWGVESLGVVAFTGLAACSSAPGQDPPAEELRAVGQADAVPVCPNPWELPQIAKSRNVCTISPDCDPTELPRGHTCPKQCSWVTYTVAAPCSSQVGPVCSPAVLDTCFEELPNVPVPDALAGCSLGRHINQGDVWLCPDSVPVPRPSADDPLARWGVIQGSFCSNCLGNANAGARFIARWYFLRIGGGSCAGPCAAVVDPDDAPPP